MLGLKKVFALLCVCVMLFAVVLTGCAGEKSDQKTLYVYNWGDYIGEGVIELFEQETGVKVVYDMFEQNEDMYTKITSGGSSSYDVIFPSDYIIEKLIREDLLAEINYDNVPNFALIDDKYKDLAFDPDNKYSVPYMWGTLGIVYDTTRVSEPVTSWSALWDPQYSREILMWDSMRDSVGLALKYLGYSVNSTNDAELEAAKAKLLEQKPLVLSYAGDQMKDQMIAGEAIMAVMYSGDASTVMEQNENLAYCVPEEGSNIWFDNMCILKTSKNKELAEQFINFMCRTDVAEMNRDYINYSTPQTEVYEALPDEIKNDPVQYPDDEIYEKCEVYVDLGDYTKVYDALWTLVLAS
ncbi:MAG: spermidine/putrescine ABC transporter substrate-binding protein [Clostridiaceae bacterium]|nr:spermidine/putrescine ABC transporter substrate-binding protein [Clostridiaceae bacterium]MDY3284957.1 spermidine/putrescine ABC transporter substrate-binding protein [Eubacteriales bacterium]